MLAIARRAHILAAIALFCAPLIAQAPPAQVPAREHLEYQVEWRIWNAGRARMDWYTSPSVKNGWEAKLHIESTGVVSRLFRVNDDYTTQMSNALCATETYMTAREGSRSRDTKVTFDSSQRRAAYQEKDLKTNATVQREIEIPACVHDIIGALYALRTLNLEPGKTISLPVSNGKKSARLRVEGQAREEIKLPIGTRKAIRYEVFAFDNQLYSRSGHLHVWLSDDARKLPLQIEIRLQFTIGTITLRFDKETQG